MDSIAMRGSRLAQGHLLAKPLVHETFERLAKARFDTYFILMSARTNYVLFDLGGVLVDVDMAPAEAAWSRLDLDSKGVVAAVVGSGAKWVGDRGQANEAQMLQTVQAAGHPSLDKSRFRAVWGSVVSWRPFVASLLHRLRVPFGVLSNIDPVHAVILGPLPGASHRIYSYNIGLMKPDPQAFEAAIDQIGVDRTTIRYLDDRADNVEAAREAGMSAHQVTSASEVEQVLADLVGVDSC